MAIYIAKHFPDLLKSTSAYLEGDIEKAFIEAYLKMDASIKEPEVLAQIQKLAKGDGDESAEAMADYEEENVIELYEEATMPLDKLVAKYQTASDAIDGAANEEVGEKPCSSSKAIAIAAGGSSKACASGSGGSSSGTSKPKEESPGGSHSAGAPNSTAKTNGEIKNEESNGSSSLNSEEKGVEVTESTGSSTKLENENKSPDAHKGSQPQHVNGNGDVKVELSECKVEVTITDCDSVDSASKGSETSPTKPRKGKVHPVPIVFNEEEAKPLKRSTPRRGTLAGLMAFAHDSDSSDVDSSDSDHPAPLNNNDGSDSDLDDEESSDDEDIGGEEDTDDSDEDEDDNFLSV